MDSISAQYEKELLEDSDKLLDYLGGRVDQINQILTDDETFCDKDINATIKYIETIEDKFHKKAQALKNKLQEMRTENVQTSENNKKQFDDELEKINDLFSKGKHREAWNKLKDYENNFPQRKRLIHYIPKLHMKESDIEQYFSLDYQATKPPIQSTTVKSSAISLSIIDDDDKQDEIIMSNKQKIREEKVIESIVVNKDNEEIEEEKNERDIDISTFGRLSKRVENQSTTKINDTITTDTKPPIITVDTKTPIKTVDTKPPIKTVDTKPPIMTVDTKPPTVTDTPRPRFPFSTRLGPSRDIQNPPVPRRDIPASSSATNNHINPHGHHEQVRLTPTPPDSVYPSTQRQTTSTQNDHVATLLLNPVSHYQHERNILLLMTSNAHYIVLFKSQLNRLDRWHLGAIERRSHIEHGLDWHDGLIISMGSTGKNNIYMFTEYEFFIYSMNQRRKIDSRILPRGNDDGAEINNLSHNEFQRGIGTVYAEYMYHIYINRSSRWTLSKTLLEKLVHIYDYDLTRIFPDVERFIHFCVNDKTISFLVQMYDLSYAVVFCSMNDCNTNEYLLPIILSHAHQPLTICSAFIQSLKQYLFFINDPSIDILHIINTKQYLQSYPISAHAICYVPDKHELMIVTNNSISSVNLNDRRNLIF